MEFNIKQAIIDRLRTTWRDNIGKVIDYMENNGFFTYHSHSHHHYPGGLAEHSWQTYQIALRLEKERCANNPNASELDADSIAIASLLHDICVCSGKRDVKGHGSRSAALLKNLGFKLTHDEFLAIRFHMSLQDKESHHFYNDALRNQLRYVVHKADCASAEFRKGYVDPHKKQDNLEPYLQNITKLPCQEIIYDVKDGWFMNLHSPYDGEIDPKWKDKIVGVRTYSTAEPIAINDSFQVAVFVLGDGNKKALFVMHHHFGMQGGCYFSPDREPFIYSEIKVYCDWGNWRPWGDNSAFHCDFGFVTCKQDNGWKLVRITQFPACSYTVLGEGFSSSEEAMESIGVYDCEKYLREGEVIVAGDS